MNLAISRVHAGLALVAMAAIVLQFFLAGVGIFGAGSIQAHRISGYIITLAAVLLLVFALGGRLGRPRIIFSALLLVLLVVQIALIESNQPWIEALHPLNALAILGVTAQLAMRGRGAVRRDPVVDSAKVRAAQGD
jgi:hypothetical protein